MHCEPLQNWLHKRSTLSPERTALITEDQVWSFRDLDEAAQRTARKLASWGVKPGAHIALLLKNSGLAAEIIHGITYLGAVMVLLNTRLTSKELSWQLAHSQAAFLIYDETCARSIEEILAGYPHIISMEAGQLKSLPEKAVPLKYEFDSEELHSIIYTSGTEGRPKGVMLCYANYWWSALGSALNLSFTPQDIWLLCLPLFHVGGLSILIRSAIYGIGVDLMTSFNPEKVNLLLDHGQITIVSLVSTMLTQLLDQRHNRPFPPALRCILLGGGPVSQKLLERCREGSVPVFHTYGMTETASQVATLSPEELFSKAGSAGRPLYFSQVKIIDQGKEAGIGMVGEITVKGPNVTKGYYQNPEASKKALVDGWLYTGDLGYLDQDGCLFVLDRRNDLIISGGENIYPAEIEAMLLTHPDVADAGVTKEQDEKWGMVPVAVIQLKKGRQSSPEELKDFCTRLMAKYKVPKAFYFVDQIPRNASHKLLRRELPKLIPGQDQKEN